MLLGVDTTSSSYNIGQITAVVVIVVIAAWLVRRALTPGFGGAPKRSRDRWIAALAVVVAGVFLVKAAGDGTFSSGNGDAWASRQGTTVRAGFLAGCIQGVAGRAAMCECAFDRMRVLPAMNTPDRFEAAAPQLQRSAADANAAELPPGVLAALRSCVAHADGS